MNKRDYPIIHLVTNLSKGTALLLLFHISVTVGDSTMGITLICSIYTRIKLVSNCNLIKKNI